ncbi:MAG TPA: glycoside hydrolase family 18 protein [Tepidisphaeraceae bacterium]
MKSRCVIFSILAIAFLLSPEALMPCTLAADRGSEVGKPVVLGYSADWFDEQYPAEKYDFSGVTHLARAFLLPRADGSIGIDENYFNPALETRARQHGIKLLMSIGGEAEKADNWLSIARHPQYLQRFLDSIGSLMQEHQYDGFDIDWEPTALTDADGLAYTSLLKAARKRFPQAIITTALPASEYWVSHFSWADVVNNVDYINVMVYCYSGAWAGRASYASNLFPASAYRGEAGYSADEGMRNLIQNHHVPPSKLLFGVTFWGLQFKVNHLGDPFPENKPGYCQDITYTDADGLAHSPLWTEHWDNAAAVPYLTRNSGGSVICYENPRSISLKCQDAQKLGCGGVMIWHLGADNENDQTPLLHAIMSELNAPAKK